MNFIQNLIFLFVFFPSTLAWAADTPLNASSTAEAAQVGAAGLSSIKLKPAVNILFGSTSNATLLSTPTAGSYAKINPSLTAEYMVSESLFLSSAFDASIKHFADGSVGSLANENYMETRGDIAWYLNEDWEMGSNLSLGYMDGHVPETGTDTTLAQLQRYLQPQVRLYGTWTGENWSYDLGATGSFRTYSTVTTDAAGNVFKNSYDDFKVDGKLGYRFSKQMKLSLKSTLSRRSYLERIAEFSDGIPSSPLSSAPNPILSTWSQEHELSLKARLASVHWTPSLGMRLERDLAYGARDSSRLKLKQKAVIPLPNRFTFEPEISIARQNYSHFRSDPGNPQNGSLRVDWDAQAVSALKLPVARRFAAQAQYSFNRKQSNYSSQSYTEHAVETGMNMQF